MANPFYTPRPQNIMPFDFEGMVNAFEGGRQQGTNQQLRDISVQQQQALALQNQAKAQEAMLKQYLMQQYLGGQMGQQMMQQEPGQMPMDGNQEMPMSGPAPRPQGSVGFSFSPQQAALLSESLTGIKPKTEIIDGRSQLITGLGSFELGKVGPAAAEKESLESIQNDLTKAYRDREKIRDLQEIVSNPAFEQNVSKAGSPTARSYFNFLTKNYGSDEAKKIFAQADFIGKELLIDSGNRFKGTLNLKEISYLEGVKFNLNDTYEQTKAKLSLMSKFNGLMISRNDRILELTNQGYSLKDAQRLAYQEIPSGLEIADKKEDAQTLDALFEAPNLPTDSQQALPPLEGPSGPSGPMMAPSTPAQQPMPQDFASFNSFAPLQEGIKNAAVGLVQGAANVPFNIADSTLGAALRSIGVKTPERAFQFTRENPTNMEKFGEFTMENALKAALASSIPNQAYGAAGDKILNASLASSGNVFSPVINALQFAGKTAADVGTGALIGGGLAYGTGDRDSRMQEAEIGAQVGGSLAGIGSLAQSAKALYGLSANASEAGQKLQKEIGSQINQSLTELSEGNNLFKRVKISKDIAKFAPNEINAVRIYNENPTAFNAQAALENVSILQRSLSGASKNSADYVLKQSADALKESLKGQISSVANQISNPQAAERFTQAIESYAKAVVPVTKNKAYLQFLKEPQSVAAARKFAQEVIKNEKLAEILSNVDPRINRAIATKDAIKLGGLLIAGNFALKDALPGFVSASSKIIQ